MNKKITLIIVLIILMTAIAGGAYLWQKATIPSVSDAERKNDLKKVLGREANETAPEIQGPTAYENEYFSLTIPKGAKRYATDEKTTDTSTSSAETKAKDPLLIENMSFDLSEPRMTVVTSVRKLPQGSTKLTDVSGVTLRKNNPKLYLSSNITKNGISGLLFTKKESGQFEKTAFFIAKGKLLTYALTAPGYSSDAEQIYNDLLEGLKIK